MDLKNLSLGEKIAGASGAALFLFLFVSWLEGLTAWELFDIVDVLLALLAIAAVALPLARAAGAELPIKPSNKSIMTRIGVVILTVTVAFLLEGADRGVGIFLSALAAVGILYGAITMPEEGAASPRRRRDRTRRPPDEDFEQPPPGMESWREGAHYGDEEPPPATGRPGGPEVTPGGSGARPRREPRAPEPAPERPGMREPRRPPEVPPARDREP